MFQDFFSLLSLLFAEVFYLNNYCQQMAKMNDRVPKERLGTSSLNYVFLKIYLYDPTSKFQE